MLLRRGLSRWGVRGEGTVDACGTGEVAASRAEELMLGCANQWHDRLHPRMSRAATLSILQ